jgi:ribosomal-protein-alanine N-acetyltransferase
VGAADLNVRPRMRLTPINVDGSFSGFDGLVTEIGRSAVNSTVQLYSKVGFIPPWTGYLAHEDGVCVGTCAFTSAPKGGVVEIAYFTFPGNEGRGVATRMATSLISLARSRAAEIFITAHTLPEENASTRILRKLGFVLVGPRLHEEDGQIWLWRFQDPMNRPNQSSEPTLASVTSPAGQEPRLP